MIRGAISGTHPLSGELIGKILDYKYGRASVKPVQDLFLKEQNDLLVLQESAGFPVLSSGYLGLEDLIRPFTRHLQCLRSYQDIGDLPLVRWHYSNTFYRKPRLIDRLPVDSDVILTSINDLSGTSSYSHEILGNKTSRIVVPGPVTLVSLIDIGGVGESSSPYSDTSALIADAGRFIGQEIAKLPVNYEEIQFDEPILVWRKIPRKLVPSIIEAYEYIRPLAGKRKAIINTYFENAKPILGLLEKLPIDGIGIDLYSTNISHLITTSFEGKILQAGVLDAKNYIPDQNGDLDQSYVKFYSNLIKTVSELKPEEIIVTSNTGLEYLPRSVADACIQQLSSIVKEVQNE